MFLLVFPERKLQFKQGTHQMIFSGNVFVTYLSNFLVIMATESKRQTLLQSTQTDLACFANRAMLSCTACLTKNYSSNIFLWVSLKNYGG